jgi:carbon-monoxide dehydrogenase small subunit
MGKELKNAPVFTVNGVTYELHAEDLDKKLVDYLRYDLGLTGTKNGCGIGSCGACTVVIDGKAKRSCITRLGTVTGSSILTIEGLADIKGAGTLRREALQQEALHPLQQAFIDAGAVQCGFCTPGMIMASYALLLENPSPSRKEIRKALEGNLCRCTGYQQIIDAVQLAASRLESL